MSRDVFGSMVLAAGICFLSLAGPVWAQPEMPQQQVPQPQAPQPAAGHPIVNALSKPAGEAATTAVMPANPSGAPTPLIRSAVPSYAESSATKVPPQDGVSEQKIKRALAEKTDILFSDPIGLKDAMDFVSSRHGIPVQVDLATLRDAGLDPTTTMLQSSVKDITLRSWLTLLLAQHGLTYVISDDVLLITTKDKANSMFETRLYNVRDLDLSGPNDVEALADIIRQTISPQSWDKTGGTGSIAPIGRNGVFALIVMQTFDGHEQIETLLSQMRKLRPQRGTVQ